jgi:hypothetical protein
MFVFSQENNVAGNPKKMDIDFKYYLPSVLGHVTGNNSFFGLREDWESVDDCTNFLVEGRGTILTFEKITYSWSFGMGGYIENNKNHDEDLLSLNMSLGAGIFLHIFDIPTFSLNGLCFYLYPMYQVPIYTQKAKSYLKWKSAIDVGYNITLLNCISVYPYFRNIIGWNSKETRYNFDCGVAIGFLIVD